jgi:hypothetical protein
MRITLTGLLVIGTLALGGCIFAPEGGGKWSGHDRVEPTLGQELLDLDRAHSAGVITTEQYERAKARLLSER